ncbi:MAG TPA: proton-conducting transporter membrane subunit [Candidatus Didemnitutus sp.]|nr:proton-conducting transporter membrane subunit [Candidatus Didemnitutus sp.]
MRPTFMVACVVSLVIAFVTSIPAVTVLVTGMAWSADIGSVTYVADSFSAFMVLVINTGSVLAALYGVRYLADDPDGRSLTESILHGTSFVALHAAMIGVVISSDLYSLFYFWEAMSISSFLLVLFDARQTKARTAAIRYILQMHIGAVGILVAIGFVSSAMGGVTYSLVHDYAASHQTWIVLLPLAVAFAMKAGLFPLHSWLPDTHAAAPSHVSGLMSGVMIKLGAYGLIRFGLLTDPSTELGTVLLVIGIATALFGIVNAIGQRDLKKLLAYSSVENMGLIVMSVGMAFIARGIDAPYIEIAAWSGVVLHILHHMLIKAVLFQSAGNILHGTHTRDLNNLGGLIHTMPGTVNLLLLGGLGISALPGSSGFVSEFPMYISGIKTMMMSSTSISMLGVFSVVTLCLAGGFAIIAFTKAIGIGALGTARTKAPLTAHDPHWTARFPQWLAFGGALFIAVAPGMVIRALSGVLYGLSEKHIPHDLLTTLDTVGIGQAVLIIVVGIVWLLRMLATRTKPVAEGPTWGCGFQEGDARIQYTATTYADSTIEIMSPVTDVSVSYRHIDPADMFPRTRSYHTEEKDLIANKVLDPLAIGVERVLRALAVLQSGNMRSYILYAFVFIVVVVVLTLAEVL